MGNFFAKRNLLPILITLNFSWLIAVAIGCYTMNDLSDIERKLLASPAAPECQTLYRELFENADVKKLNELKSSKYNVIAVQAAWELFRLTSKDSDNKMRRELTNRHVGFLEGRLRVVIPNWWINEATGRKENSDADFKYATSGVADVSCSVDMSINEIDDVYRISKGKDSVELSKDFLSGQLATGPWQVNCGFTNDFFYLVIHDLYGRPCSLECF